MTLQDADKRNRVVHTGLALILIASGVVPSLANASHGIPQVLDRRSVGDDGGYVAWHIDVSAPQDGGPTPVFFHFGEHQRPTVRNASYAYFGFWLVNLDYNSVELALVSTLEMDGADAHVRTQSPQSTDRHLAVTENEWSGRMGGQLRLSAGEWLAVPFWSTKGTVDADMTLGSSVEGGQPLVELVSHTEGTSVFSHENHEFQGDRNVHLAADAENTCSVGECGPVRNAQVQTIQDGTVRESVDHRLFGYFGAPGSEDDLSWLRGDAGGEDSQRYWFHGAASGEYAFHVDDYTRISSDREPVVTFGADVRLPSSVVPAGGQR